MGLGRNIGIFRHGLANYSQRETRLDEARDLTLEGIEKVRIRTAEFLQYIGLSPVIIRSSPMGRTLHTSKLIRSCLQEGGVRVYPIEIDSELTEVHGFEWNLFNPLVVGGRVDYAGRSFEIDPNKTNPSHLTHSVYFMKDACHDLDGEVLAGLPSAYIEAIARFERFGSVKARSGQFLRRVCGEETEATIIGVTHDALICPIISAYSGGKVLSLNPGDYIHLLHQKEGLIAKRTPGLAEGAKVDILNNI